MQRRQLRKWPFQALRPSSSPRSIHADSVSDRFLIPYYGTLAVGISAMDFSAPQ
jgi:hypothetical protein